MNLQDQPRLQSTAALLLTGISHEEGAVLLTEAGSSLSFVIARSVFTKRDATLVLQDCQWCSFMEEEIGLLPLEEVRVSRDRCWQAESPAHARLLRHPGIAPYQVWFPPQDVYAQLLDDLDTLRVSTALKTVIEAFAVSENFRLSPTGHLLAPPDYAAAPADCFSGIFLEFPDEFLLR